jgi:hypothetical protein
MGKQYPSTRFRRAQPGGSAGRIGRRGGGQHIMSHAAEVLDDCCTCGFVYEELHVYLSGCHSKGKNVFMRQNLSSIGEGGLNIIRLQPRILCENIAFQAFNLCTFNLADLKIIL